MMKYIIIIFTTLFLSACQKQNIDKGLISAKSKSKVSYAESEKLAVDLIYSNMASYICEKTKRSDTNIIDYDLRNMDMIDSNSMKIKRSYFFGNYKTKITVSDLNLKTKMNNAVSYFTREGKVEKYIRAFAKIDYPDNLTLYAKSVLERDAFIRAKKNMRQSLSDEKIAPEKIESLLNKSYIIEETYKDKVYTVVIETILEGM